MILYEREMNNKKFMLVKKLDNRGAGGCHCQSSQ